MGTLFITHDSGRLFGMKHYKYNDLGNEFTKALARAQDFDGTSYLNRYVESKDVTATQEELDSIRKGLKQAVSADFLAKFDEYQNKTKSRNMYEMINIITFLAHQPEADINTQIAAETYAGGLI